MDDKEVTFKVTYRELKYLSTAVAHYVSQLKVREDLNKEIIPQFEVLAKQLSTLDYETYKAITSHKSSEINV